MPKREQPALPGTRSGPFPPLLATLLADRRTGAILSGAAALLVLLQSGGIAGWICPLDAALGQNCPGCGLTRSLVQLAEGHWQLALRAHPLAPIAAATLLLSAATAVLPAGRRLKMTSAVARLEARSGIGLLILAVWIVHWIGRLGGLWPIEG